MSPLVKHLLKKRKQAMRTNDEETITRLQNQINRLIHSNQVNAVKNEKMDLRNGGVKLTA
jgi:predicted ATP-binding protein involved in virulence